jgi:methionyl-tRNA formyltransferase
MKSLNIAYFGSSYFSANLLEHILIDKELPVNLKFIVTQPDQKAGRKQILTPTPVKLMAEKYKIKLEILNPKSQINQKSQIQNSKHLEFGISNLFGTWNLEFSALKSIDLALVYAYGDLIPKKLLGLPKYGFWNIHPSLLPKYRGPSPIATPLINGDKITGVTIIKMDEKIDHGPIIVQESLTIGEDDKRPDLEKKLTDLAFKMFKEIIKSVILGTQSEAWRTPESLLDSGQARMTPTPQQHQLATYTKKLTKQSGFIKFEELKKAINNETMKQSNNKSIFNLFRGLSPWPGIWTMIKPIQPTRLDEAKRLKITDLKLVDGKLVINKVQLEGKNEVDFETFNKAYVIFCDSIELA